MSTGQGQKKYEELQPWQRPPFEKGNTLSTHHGAYSPRRVEPLASEILETVLPDLKWVVPSDMPAMWAWARAEAACQLLTEYLEKLADGDEIPDLESKRVASAYTLLDRAETRAANMRRRLGLDPLSRSKLGKDAAATEASLASLMAKVADDRENDR